MNKIKLIISQRTEINSENFESMNQQKKSKSRKKITSLKIQSENKKKLKKSGEYLNIDFHFRKSLISLLWNLFFSKIHTIINLL